MAPTKLIIDTDPGNDDVLAMLLALTAKPEELEVLMISVTYGNVDAQNCLRNVVTMFHIIEKEMEWRRSQGLPEGFETLKKTKPLVAVGADAPLGDQRIMADYFHGKDGLAGVHETVCPIVTVSVTVSVVSLQANKRKKHPHFTPSETWKHLFEEPPVEAELSKAAPTDAKSVECPLFTPSTNLSWREILRILKENPADTISIAAVGPMTNLALAAAEDPLTLMKAKEILVMGGVIDLPGNMTPLAEFNTFADAHAAARVYALSSPNPSSTMPIHAPGFEKFSSGESSDPEAAALKDYPHYRELGERRLNVVLFPLDITERHLMWEKHFDPVVDPLIQRGSPLASWMKAWVGGTFRKLQSLRQHMPEANFQLHDPMTIWYAIDGHRNAANWKVQQNVDIRVETAGQWSRGFCVVDRRTARKKHDNDGEGGAVAGDEGLWLSSRTGNRLGWCVESPGESLLGELIIKQILT